MVKNNKLEKEVEEIRDWIIEQTVLRVNTGGKPNKDYDHMYHNSVKNILKLFSTQQEELIESFKKIIGEDEEEHEDWNDEQLSLPLIMSKNELRAAQRKALDNLRKEKK